MTQRAASAPPEWPIVLQEALERVTGNHARYPQRFPLVGDGLAYQLSDNTHWQAGFWTGLLWLAYAASDRAGLRTHAEALLPSFRDRLERRVHINHDLGFLFTLSARAQWQLTGSPAARGLALQAAHDLAERFRPAGRYIQAWNAGDDDQAPGRMIVDTLMNLPLLFWAASQTDTPQLHTVAQQHAETSLRYLMRPDGSSYHTFLFDPASGAPRGGRTHQGYADDSLWARGQAWAVYGFALAAEWCSEQRFAQGAAQALERLLAELPPDGVPTWDLRLPPGAPPFRDSSAGAIAACGALRLARLQGEPANGPANTAARRLVGALIEHCYERSSTSHGLLRHGCLHAPKGWAVDSYLILGDYFFLEALLTLAGQAPDFWGRPAALAVVQPVRAVA